MIHRELLIDGHFIGGVCDQSVGKQLVRAPWDGAVVGTAAEGGWMELNTCLQAAKDAFESWRREPRAVRQRLLREIARLVRERSEELVDVLTREVAKPITWSRAEVARLALTFDYAADALSTYGTESVPVDMDPRGGGYRCVVDRVPIGVVFAIVPYNWPFNLAAHKLAPALAAGNTVVLKVSDRAPLSTLTLARLIHEAGCPPGVVNAWNGPTPVVAKAVADEWVAMVSFTGSPAVGWSLKDRLPRKRVTLELGGNASAVVCGDADLAWAVPRIAAGGYGYAGQVCIAVQHVWVHASRYNEVRTLLAEATETCPTGDPLDPSTVCGPLISEEAAAKVERMVSESGGHVLAGGKREGALMWPTLVENPDAASPLSTEEAFGPVLTLSSYEDEQEVYQRINRSRFGIHCGVFTHDLRIAEAAFREIEVGGVVVNDYPTLRFDNMPYGGVKTSGFGREGIRWALDEMTDPKVMLTRTQ